MNYIAYKNIDGIITSVFKVKIYDRLKKKKIICIVIKFSNF